MKMIYQICIPHTKRDFFDYESEDQSLLIGSRVMVPFRKQIRMGIVIGTNQTQVKPTALKGIISRIDEQPVLDEELFTLCQWISTYYQSPLSEVLPLALPKKLRQGQPYELPMCDFYELSSPLEVALNSIPLRAHKKRELLTYLAKEHKPVSKKILNQSGFTSSHLMSLVQAGMIHLSQQIIKPESSLKSNSLPLKLNPEQEAAVASINKHLNHYHCFLLQGITGSGKTEVYLQVIAEVLKKQKQILIMVPEIGLTPQLLARFTDRFSEPMVVLHSNLNETERTYAWQMARENHAKLVIGTRSALFTPMPHLGLIVIDEEHDASLKQMEGVRYSARDSALIRAFKANIPIILGTATPSLESLYNCKNNKYSLLRLNKKALSSTPLQYQLIDLRAQSLENGLAHSSLKSIEEHLKQNNQILVFINRRGFAPVLLCHQCGWMADCRACDSHLTMHKHMRQMICHHCGLMQKIPLHCHKCQSRELIPVGAGTQRIHEFLSTRFPKHKVLRIDRDEVQKKNAFNEQLEKINTGEAQIIVGTQMLAKGHHFPKLSLVIVVDADAGLYSQDFKALENLGQLLTQVSGRAGRAEIPGQVIIQTHAPQHPLLNLLIQQGYDEFAKALLDSREQAQLPPFQHLAVIRAQSVSQSKVLDFLLETKNQIRINPLSVMGPAPAPLPRKANQHRMQLLIKSPSRKILHSSLTELREWLTMNKLSNNVRWNVDVDPMDLT